MMEYKGYKLTDVEFMTADEKRRVLRAWERFLKVGLLKPSFTKALYHHLTQHCSFIAHYDRHGFYATYFTDPKDTRRFLSQFDRRNIEPSEAVPKSIEYGMTYWGDGDYADINRAMVEIAFPYIVGLERELAKQERKQDLTEAKRLLAKHGVMVAKKGG